MTMGKKRSKTVEGQAVVIESQTPRHTPAQNEALATRQIAKAILANFDDTLLLSSMQRVCKLWKDAASELLQPHFCLDEDASHDDSPFVSSNQILSPHFNAILSNITEPQRISIEPVFQRHGFDKSALGMSIANTASAKVQHKAFIRRGASWRNMLVSSPPIFDVQFTADRIGQSPPRSEIVNVPEGLRMGQLYDLICSIITRPDKNGIYDAIIEWPRREPTGEVDEEYEVGGAAPLIIRKAFEEYKPSFTKWDEKDRRWRTRRIASKKWMLLCEEFDKEKLILNPW